MQSQKRSDPNFRPRTATRQLMRCRNCGFAGSRQYLQIEIMGSRFYLCQMCDQYRRRCHWKDFETHAQCQDKPLDPLECNCPMPYCATHMKLWSDKIQARPCKNGPGCKIQGCKFNHENQSTRPKVEDTK